MSGEVVAWLPSAALDPAKRLDFYTAARFKICDDSVPVSLATDYAALLAEVEAMRRREVLRQQLEGDIRASIAEFREFIDKLQLSRAARETYDDVAKHLSIIVTLHASRVEEAALTDQGRAGEGSR